MSVQISATDRFCQQRHYLRAGAPIFNVRPMPNHEKRRAKTTPADRAAAARALAIWRRMPKAERPSQDEIAATFVPPITQGAVSQYLHGKIPMGSDAVYYISRALRCPPTDIRTDLPPVAQGPGWPFARVTADRFASLPRDWRAAAEGALLSVIIEFETGRVSAKSAQAKP